MITDIVLNYANEKNVAEKSRDEITGVIDFESRILSPNEQNLFLEELNAAKKQQNEFRMKLNTSERETFDTALNRSRRDLHDAQEEYLDIVQDKKAIDHGTFRAHLMFPVSSELAKEATELIVSDSNWKANFDTSITDYGSESGFDKSFRSHEELMRKALIKHTVGEGVSDVTLPAVFAGYSILIGSILVIIAGANGSLRITPSNCDMSQYAVGQPFPVATREFYGNRDIGLSADWYLQPWNLRPYQGLCSEALHMQLDEYTWGEALFDITFRLYGYRSEDEKMKWYGCIRRTNPLDHSVFYAMDVANLPTVTNFSESWDKYTSYFQLSRGVTIFIGCFVLLG